MEFIVEPRCTFFVGKSTLMDAVNGRRRRFDGIDDSIWLECPRADFRRFIIGGRRVATTRCLKQGAADAASIITPMAAPSSAGRRPEPHEVCCAARYSISQHCAASAVSAHIARQKQPMHAGSASSPSPMRGIAACRRQGLMSWRLSDGQIDAGWRDASSRARASISPRALIVSM